MVVRARRTAQLNQEQRHERKKNNAAKTHSSVEDREKKKKTYHWDKYRNKQCIKKEENNWMKTVYYCDDFIIFIVPRLIVKRSNSTNLFITGSSISSSHAFARFSAVRLFGRAIRFFFLCFRLLRFVHSIYVSGGAFFPACVYCFWPFVLVYCFNFNVSYGWFFLRACKIALKTESRQS